MKIRHLTPAITWIEPASMSNFSACGDLGATPPLTSPGGMVEGRRGEASSCT